jgi:hypothetical protein
MNTIHFLFSVADNHPRIVEGLSEDKRKMIKRIVDVCPGCLKLKTCQKGCEKIREEPAMEGKL